MNHFARNGDNILIGRFLGAATLGLYSRAYAMLMLPIQQLNGPISSVAIPALSRLQNEPERFRNYYRKTLGLMVLLSVPLVAWMLVSAHHIILLVLGEAWEGAIPLFRALGGAAMVGTINIAGGWLFVCLGRTDRQFRAVALHSLGLVIAFVVGLPWGAFGVAVACSAATVAFRVPYLAYAAHGTPVQLRDIGKVLLFPLLSSAIASTVTYTSDYYLFTQIGAFPSLLLTMVLFGATYLSIMFAHPDGRDTLKNFWYVLKEMRGKKWNTEEESNRTVN